MVDAWAGIVGQERAAARLRAAAARPGHAYLLVGPEGWGARALARSFAADVLADGLGPEDADRVRTLTLAEEHADLVLAPEPEGNVLRREEIGELIRFAYRHPTEGERKVIVVPSFHRAGEVAWNSLLKVLEEPPASTVWVLLADDARTEMATISSRCITVELDPVTPSMLTERLVAEGHPREAAEQAATAASGDLDLARLLVGDERLAVRVEAWRRVPEHLDGTGHAAWRLAGELRAAIDDALAHVKVEFDATERQLAARIDELKLAKGPLTKLVESNKRRLRRARTAELRLGLGALAARYRDALAAGPDRRRIATAIDDLDATYEALFTRNANEAIQLQALFLRLPSLP